MKQLKLLAVATGIALTPATASAQWQYQAMRAYPYAQRWVQNPSMPNTLNRFYQGGRQYFAPRQSYYYQPQWRFPQTTPYMTRPYR